MAKVSTSTLTITLAIVKSKDNPPSHGLASATGVANRDTSPMNTRRKRQVNMADYEERDDVITETDQRTLISSKNMMISSLVLFRKCFAARRSLIPCKDIKSSIQDVRSRIRSVILLLTMKVARTSSLERKPHHHPYDIGRIK